MKRNWGYKNCFLNHDLDEAIDKDNNANKRNKSDDSNQKNKNGNNELPNTGTTFTYEEVQILLKYTYEVAYESGRNDAAKKMKNHIDSMIDSIVSDIPANDSQEA